MFDFDKLVVDYTNWLPLIIFLARVTDVSMGTIRTIFIIRGMRLRASVIGFIEVSVWVIAVSSVVRQLHNPLNIVAYAGGFAVGNWVGMWFEQKLAIGQQIMRVISRDHGHAIAEAIRQLGYIVTEVVGKWRAGDVTICFMAPPRRQVDMISKVANEIDPKALITVEDLRSTNGSFHEKVAKSRNGWRAVLKKK